MDFTLSTRGETFRSRIQDFVEQELIPLEEQASSYDEHENISEDMLQVMRQKAKAQGLWSLQTPQELGGQGLSTVEMAACYEAMNRRSEEHTSELQSLMRIAYAVFCLKKKNISTIRV